MSDKIIYVVIKYTRIGMKGRQPTQSESDVFSFLKKHLPENVYRAYFDMGVDQAISRLKDLQKQSKPPHWANTDLMNQYSMHGWFKMEENSPDTKLKELLNRTPDPESFYENVHKKMLDAAIRVYQEVEKEYQEVEKEYQEVEKEYQSKQQKIPNAPIDEVNKISNELYKLQTKKAKLQGKKDILIGYTNELNIEQNTKETTLDFYKNRIHKACNYLRAERDVSGKMTTGLKIIKDNPSPVTRFFENVFHAVMTVINPGYAIGQIEDSKKHRGHSKFWKPKGYDLVEPMKEAEKILGITISKKSR